MKQIPKIYVNKINKINNNKEVYYSYKDDNKDEIIEEIKEEINIPNEFDMQHRLDELFRANDFIYKKKFHIKTKYGEGDYVIISKSYDYLLTINGERIYISNILEIN